MILTATDIKFKPYTNIITIFSPINAPFQSQLPRFLTLFRCNLFFVIGELNEPDWLIIAAIRDLTLYNYPVFQEVISSKIRFFICLEAINFATIFYCGYTAKVIVDGKFISSQSIDNFSQTCLRSYANRNVYLYHFKQESKMCITFKNTQHCSTLIGFECSIDTILCFL